LLIYELIGIIVGGKLFTCVLQINGKCDFLNAGFSSFGSLIGAILMIILFAFQSRKKIIELLYVFITVTPLMYSIGKIGCFIAGCCRGIEYNGIGKVIYKYGYNATGLSYFPIQLIESIIFMIIFIFLYNIHNKNRFNKKVLGISFIICGFLKFILDFLRLDHNGKIISNNQIFCIIFVIVGIIMYIKNNNKIALK